MKRKGFTLIEIIVVLSILGVLTGFGGVKYVQHIKDADILEGKVNCSLLEGAIVQAQIEGKTPIGEEVQKSGVVTYVDKEGVKEGEVLERQYRINVNAISSKVDISKIKSIETYYVGESGVVRYYGKVSGEVTNPPKVYPAPPENISDFYTLTDTVDNGVTVTRVTITPGFLNALSTGTDYAGWKFNDPFPNFGSKPEVIDVNGYKAGTYEFATPFITGINNPNLEIKLTEFEGRLRAWPEITNSTFKSLSIKDFNNGEVYILFRIMNACTVDSVTIDSLPNSKTVMPGMNVGVFKNSTVNTMTIDKIYLDNMKNGTFQTPYALFLTLTANELHLNKGLTEETSFLVPPKMTTGFARGFIQNTNIKTIFVNTMFEKNILDTEHVPLQTIKSEIIALQGDKTNEYYNFIPIKSGELITSYRAELTDSFKSALLSRQNYIEFLYDTGYFPKLPENYNNIPVTDISGMLKGIRFSKLNLKPLLTSNIVNVSRLLEGSSADEIYTTDLRGVTKIENMDNMMKNVEVKSRVIDLSGLTVSYTCTLHELFAGVDSNTLVIYPGIRSTDNNLLNELEAKAIINTFNTIRKYEENSDYIPGKYLDKGGVDPNYFTLLFSKGVKNINCNLSTSFLGNKVRQPLSISDVTMSDCVVDIKIFSGEPDASFNSVHMNNVKCDNVTIKEINSQTSNTALSFILNRSAINVLNISSKISNRFDIIQSTVRGGVIDIECMQSDVDFRASDLGFTVDYSHIAPTTNVRLMFAEYITPTVDLTTMILAGRDLTNIFYNALTTTVYVKDAQDKMLLDTSVGKPPTLNVIVK